MKIVDRKTFLALPPNTVYAKYEPCVFGDLHIKGESWVSPHPGDWWEVSLADAIDFHDSGQFCEDLERARETGCSLRMDFECETRDGLYDEHQLFAVFEPQDVAALIARLQKCVPITHPVDALKQCGVEMTAEQEAKMREYCDAPVRVAMTIEKAREIADGYVRNLLYFSCGDEALIRNFNADQLEAIAVLMRAGEL